MNQEKLNAIITDEVQEMYDALQSDEVIDDNNEDIFVAKNLISMVSATTSNVQNMNFNLS